MKIGIDIDGVLTDIVRFHLEYGSKFAYENGIYEISDPAGYEVNDMFDFKDISFEEFWKKYDNYYIEDKYTRAFGPEIVQKLKEEGHKIHIITARDPKFELGNMWTKKWLKDSNIPYDKLVFREDKYEYCVENKIDLMIEDDPKNIKKISKIIPVICFDERYNQGIEGKNITRCYSWYDIYSKIKNKTGEKK